MCNCAENLSDFAVREITRNTGQLELLSIGLQIWIRVICCNTII